MNHKKIRDENRNERRDRVKSRLFNDKEFHPEKDINIAADFYIFLGIVISFRFISHKCSACFESVVLRMYMLDDNVIFW